MTVRIYPDACVVIDLVLGEPALRQRLNAALCPDDNRAAPEVAYSDLTRLECRVKPLAAGNAALLARYDRFFATPGYIRVALDTAVFDQATELRARRGLKTPDALHLAAAITSGCHELWTNDERLVRAADNRIRVVTIDQIS